MAGCCTRSTLFVVSVCLLIDIMRVSAGDVNYRDVVVDQQRSDFMSRYFQRLYRRPQHCDEPGLADRVRMADVILTGTIRALEADSQRPGSDVARVEVKRVFKDYRQSDARHSRRSIYVRGIGDSNTCGSDAGLRDSWIFLLRVVHDADSSSTLRLNSSLIRITLTNIDRIEELVGDQPTRVVDRHHVVQPTTTTAAGRRTTTATTTTTTVDPCWTMTCHHGARCVLEDGAARCRCPPSRCSTHGTAPVCGTDHTDYTSECEMRAASCRLQKHIGKLYDGHCDNCREKQCDFHSECVTDSHGTATCVCPTESSCPQVDSSPLCGSDGQFYWSQCEIQVAACRLRQHIDLVDAQYCDPCYRVNCSGRGQHCVDGRCVCRRHVCPTNYDPVCGSDSVTYPNQCTLDLIACTERRDVDTLHRGVCKDEFMGSGFEDWQIVPPSGSDDDQVPTDTKTTTKTTTTTTRTTTTAENGRCGDSMCQYGAVCVSDDRGRRQQCVCRFSCDAVRSAVCGSDGQLYASECLMNEQSCRLQKHIAVAPIDNCEEVNMEVEMCDGQDPLVNPVTGRQFNCDDEPCPTGSYCHRLAHQPSRCCLGDDGVSVVTSCDVTEYGCCPDGVTAALGRHHAGCPSKCRCNSLGSLASTCDAETGQCRCKRGVGGLRCDRCEPSYWGLQLAADNRNSAGGCIPCGCNIYGSIRDDCDQMTGQCRCRPLVSGHKCDQCADGATVGPNGCQLLPPGIELKDEPAAAASGAATSRDECSRDKCHHGAVCDEKDGRTQCVCPYDCSSSRGPAVCATDGRRYKSLCHLLRRACRRQQPIRQSLADRC